MSFLSFFNKKNKEVSLLLDIGNGSITTSLVLFSKNDLPEFLYIDSKPFLVSEKPNASKLVKDMQSIVENSLHVMMKIGFTHKYWKNNPKKISKVLISFSSPWFASKTKHINLVKDKSFVITKAFLEDILKKEEELFKEELIDNDSSKNDFFEVVEKNIVHTKINGYTVSDSLNKNTKRFDAFVHLSVIGKNVIEKIENVISKHTHINKNRISVHTFPLVSFIVIRDIFPTTKNFLMMDVTADVTDITLVIDDVIMKSATIPSGRNFILRQIGKKLDASFEVAESIMRLFTTNKLDKTTSDKIENVLIDVEKEWSIYLETALSELGEEAHIPPTVYFTSDYDVYPIYSEFLKLQKTDSTAIFRKSLKIINIDRETLSHLYKTSFPGKTNEFISMVAIFYNKFFQEN